jgi:hypothetical protein
MQARPDRWLTKVTIYRAARLHEPGSGQAYGF